MSPTRAGQQAGSSIDFSLSVGGELCFALGGGHEEEAGLEVFDGVGGVLLRDHGGVLDLEGDVGFGATRDHEPAAELLRGAGDGLHVDVVPPEEQGVAPLGDLVDAEERRRIAEQGHFDEAFDGGRRVTEAVDEFVRDVHRVLARTDVGDAPVHGETMRDALDVVLRDVRVDLDVDEALALWGVGSLSGCRACRSSTGRSVRAVRQQAGRSVCRAVRAVQRFLFFDGLREDLQVHVVADGFHVAVLLRAQDGAGAAEFEVAHGDLEAGAELGVLADGGETPLRDVRQFLAAVEREVGGGAAGGAADAATDLVQLREAEAVGVLDDQRVDVRDVDARLDDRRADEDVDLACRSAPRSRVRASSRRSG